MAWEMVGGWGFIYSQKLGIFYLINQGTRGQALHKLKKGTLIQNVVPSVVLTHMGA